MFIVITKKIKTALIAILTVVMLIVSLVVFKPWAMSVYECLIAGMSNFELSYCVLRKSNDR